MSKFQSGWYLIYTRPRHEKKIYAYLNEREVLSFLPTRKILRHWHDREKLVSEPLFPSYLFVYLDSIKGYYTGMDTDGVLYFVRTGKEMARVSEDLINNIKLVTENAEQLEVSSERFLPGKQLMICKGALTGLFCEIVRVEKRQKLMVRVDLLNRNLLIGLPIDYVYQKPESFDKTDE